MKIIHFIHTFQPESIGGTEIYVYELSKAQITSGHSVAIITPTLTNLPEHEIIDGIEIYRINVPRRNPVRITAPYNPLVEDFIRKKLIKLKPDIVHIHHWHNLTDNIAAICSDLGFPTIATVQDFYIKCPLTNNLLDDFLFCYDFDCNKCFGQDSIQREFVLRKKGMMQEIHYISKIIVPSRFIKARLKELYNIDHIEVIENGVSQIHTQKRIKGFKDKLTIGYWGVVRYNKGIHVLIKAIQKLHEKGLNNFNVLIFGATYDIEYEQKLKQMAAGLPVTFCGQYDRKDLSSFNIDIAVFPSIFLETYCYALSEAFQIGIPVLVPEFGAFKERLTGGGDFFEIGNANNLAVKLERILSDKSYYDTLCESIPKNLLSIEEYEKIVSDIYREVISQYRPNHNVKSNSLENLIYLYEELIKNEAELHQLKPFYNQYKAECDSKQNQIENIENDNRLKQQHINNVEKDNRLKQQHIENIESDNQSKQKQIENIENDNRSKQQHIENIESNLRNYQQTLNDIYNSRTWKLKRMIDSILGINKG